ncbi:MAG: hypothetical protein ABI586_03630 [Candidatus Nanopelagicales bacterium]
MPFDPNNTVIALCAAGMAVEGTPDEARALFEQAWAARQDDYDAAIAAHYLARHQPTPESTLEWNGRAVAHAEAVADDRAGDLLASLYLNWGDSLRTKGDVAAARDAAERAARHLNALPDDGYRALIAQGIARLQARVSDDRDQAPVI